ncbi:MAG: hypothetical protein NT098_00865 [Candidatus Parcubacteria bacterium]|nr:hypothetical protein [Candidatus Parcubacteria bacterium]
MLVPVHPSDAVQVPVVLVDDHLRMVFVPLATEVGVAVRETVGVAAFDSFTPPKYAPQKTRRNRAIGEKLFRNRKKDKCIKFFIF